MLRSGNSPGEPVGIGAYSALEAIAGANLELGNTVVIDAVNPVEPVRRMWRDLADRVRAVLSVVEITCSDSDEHQRRVERRQADIEGHKLPRWDDVLRHEYEPWTEERLTVDAAAQGGTVVDEILRYLDR